MAKELTKRQAEVWALRHEEKLGYTEIAARLGISTGNVYGHLKIAERKLGTDGSGVKVELKTAAERILQKFDEIEELIAETGDGALSRLYRDRRLRALAYMDDHAMATATLPQLATAVSAMTQNIQLQEGKPTAITQYSDLRKLDEVIEDAMAELKRRGRLIDVTPENPESAFEEPEESEGSDAPAGRASEEEEKGD